MFRLVLDRPCRSSVVCRNLSRSDQSVRQVWRAHGCPGSGPQPALPGPWMGQWYEGMCNQTAWVSSLTWTEFCTLMVVSHSLVICKFGQIHFTYLAKYNFFLLRVLTFKWGKQYVLLLILILSLSNSERFSLFTCKKFRVSWWSQLQPFQSCLPLDFSHSPAPESILWHSPLPTSAFFFCNHFLFFLSLKWY